MSRDQYLGNPNLKKGHTKSRFSKERIEEVLKFGKNSGKVISMMNNSKIFSKIINLIKEFKTQNKRS